MRENESLVFNSDWSKFRVKGLQPQSAQVVRLDANGDAFFMSSRGQGSCTSDCVYFAGDSSGQDNLYFVASADGMQQPVIRAAVDSTLNWEEANYLVISHPDFMNTTQQLLENFTQEMQAKYESADLVDIETIYAAYSGGVVDAQSLREYIQDAYRDRGTRHVLLVGGDTYDYRGYQDTGARSFIPSLYVSVANNLNAIPSDSSYGLIDADLVQDISVSRLPVRSTSDLAQLLEKRQNYLSRNYANEALFIADKVDAAGYSFKNGAQNLIGSHFDSTNTAQVFLDDQSVADSRASISSSINSGVGLTTYFGHSSTDRWSLNGLFSGDDVAGLTNHNSPTVVTQLGCWNTFYVSPSSDSMAHRLLLDGSQGAVTVMGAASLTEADAELRMADYLFANLQQGQSIGDAVLAAKQKIANDTPNQLDVLLGWVVLGFDDYPVFQ